MAPTYLGTRPGTQLGARLGSLGPSADKLLYALTNFSPLNFYATQPGGGEAGIETGFGGALLAYLVPTATSTSRYLVANYSVYPATGYFLSTGGVHASLAFDAIGSSGNFTQLALTGLQLGRVALFVYQLTPTTMQLWAARGQKVERAIAGYATPQPAQHMIGRGTYGGGAPATDTRVIDHATWRGVLTDTQVDELYASTRQLGRLPDAIAGVTHRWPVPGALEGLTQAPASLPDAVMGASADAMVGAGAVQVVAIDQTLPKAWSYEVSPVLRGASGFAQAHHYSSIVPFDLNMQLPWWIMLSMRVDSQDPAMAAVTRRIAGDGDATTTGGFHYFTQTRNSTLGFGVLQHVGGVTSLASVIYTLAAGDAGTVIQAIATSDGTRLRYYVKRAAEAGNVTITSSALVRANAPLILGKDNRTATTAAEGSTIFGLSCGQVGLSVPQVSALIDKSIASDGDVQDVPGATSHLWSLARESSNAPAQITDRVGTMHLQRVGSPIYAPMYNHAFVS